MSRENLWKKFDNGRSKTNHDMHKGGSKVKDISEILLVTHSKISNVIRRQKGEKRLKRHGRKPLLSART